MLHFNFPPCLQKLLFLSSCFIFLTNPIFAQTEVNPCELPPPTFEGTPQTTLCDEYEQSSYSLEIGVGTSFIAKAEWF